MADEVFDGADMVRQLLREGQRVTDEAGDALPQRVIEALNMIGFAGVLCDGFVLRRGNDPGVDRILIRIEGRLRAVHRRQIGPQLFRTLMTAITDMEGNDLPCLCVHGEPDPLFVRLALHEAPHLVGFGFHLVNDHLSWTCRSLPIEVIGTRRCAYGYFSCIGSIDTLVGIFHDHSWLLTSAVLVTVLGQQ